MIKTLDIGRYLKNAIKNGWPPAYKARWAYHAKAIEIAKKLSLSHPRMNAGKVLEIGSFGAQIVIGSDTMDLQSDEWKTPVFSPTYSHDARVLPWPIESEKYLLLVALRLWHHLAPVQEQCFREAKRVALNVLIECPEKEIVGQGITRAQFIAWNDGVLPVEEYDMGEWGRLYLWRGNEWMPF
jgi:hypothetical protein